MTMTDDPAATDHSAMALARAAMEARRHNTRLLTALRETQVEHGQRLDRIEAKLADHDRRFDAIDQRFEAMEGELSSIKNTLGRVAVGMYTLEKLIRRIVPHDAEENAN